MQIVQPQSLALLVSAALSLNGCIEIDRDSQRSALNQRILLGRGVIEAEAGGTVASNLRRLHEGVELVIPPDALEQDTEISLFVRYGDPRFPSAVQSFEIEPASLRLAVPAILTIEYAREYERVTETVFAQGAIEVFWVGDRDLVHFLAQARDRELNELTAEIDRFGTFVAIHAQLQALLFQEPRIIDPQQAITLSIVQGQAITSTNGDQSVFVGKGSLDSFWSSDSDANLLLIHGLMGTPFHMQGQNSFIPMVTSAGFNQDFANIVVYQYASGLSLTDNSNHLYDIIQQNRREGFGCNVLAHSSGGLLARYAIERSHLDPERKSFAVEDRPLGPLMPNLVTVGTPNQGSSQIQSIFSRMLQHMTDADQPFVQGILDVLPGTEAFPSLLNTGWVKPETRYFAIAGDVNGTRTDGLVEVLSAIGRL